MNSLCIVLQSVAAIKPAGRWSYSLGKPRQLMGAWLLSDVVDREGQKVVLLDVLEGRSSDFATQWKLRCPSELTESFVIQLHTSGLRQQCRHDLLFVCCYLLFGTLVTELGKCQK